MRLKLLLALSTLFLPMALLATSAPAGATGSCASGYYPQRTFSYGGAAVAVLCLSNEGAGHDWRLDSLGRYRGVTKYMSIKLCRFGSDGRPTSTCRRDEGQYRYYAGPVSDSGLGFPWIHVIMYDGGGRQIVDQTLDLRD